VSGLRVAVADGRPIPNGDGPIANGGGLIAAVGGYESQMRAYGYAAVAASRQAEAETGMRRHRLMFWLYRRTAGTRG
jgi:hypothetical protein